MNDLNRVHRFWILFTGTRTTFSSEISSVSSDIIHSQLMDVGWTLGNWYFQGEGSQEYIFNALNATAILLSDHFVTEQQRQ